jgi:hypothetical protein
MVLKKIRQNANIHIIFKRNATTLSDKKKQCFVLHLALLEERQI